MKIIGITPNLCGIFTSQRNQIPFDSKKKKINSTEKLLLTKSYEIYAQIWKISTDFPIKKNKTKQMLIRRNVLFSSLNGITYES